MNKPLVSICCITYNHEKYIRQCLDGFLMQKTNFKYEIVIHDDASTDRTVEIIQEYVERYPALFVPIYQTENQYSRKIKPLVKYVFPKASGKYIAICEGDDFWVDPLKLQKQIDFLEKNDCYNFSMGRVDMLFEQTGEVKKRKELVNTNNRETFHIKDYIKAPFSQTSSFVFRNSHEPLPEWLNTVHAGDQSLVVIKTGINGKIKYHRELFSIYRKHADSVSHTTRYNSYQKFVETLYFFEEHLDNNFTIIFKINRLRFRLKRLLISKSGSIVKIFVYSVDYVLFNLLRIF